MIGIVAEMMAFESLSKVYSKVVWVSKNASRIPVDFIGYNPEGLDGLGYDIEYVDSHGNTVMVEVKGRSDDTATFEIYKNEVDVAMEKKDLFKIFFVTHVMNNNLRRILDLGNIFALDSGEDFFNNSKFRAEYRNFEIRFLENALK